MSNYLKMPKKTQVLALLELGWSYRRIEAETGKCGKRKSNRRDLSCPQADVPVLPSDEDPF
jgi:hypothetical protein